jgi:hypothetical protein
LSFYAAKLQSQLTVVCGDMQTIVAKHPECSLPVKRDPALQEWQKRRDDAQQMMQVQQRLIGNARRLGDKMYRRTGSLENAFF